MICSQCGTPNADGSKFCTGCGTRLAAPVAAAMQAAVQETPVYEQPAPVYEEPAPVYEEPAPTYEQPAPAYEQPQAYAYQQAQQYQQAPQYQQPQQYQQAPQYQQPQQYQQAPQYQQPQQYQQAPQYQQPQQYQQAPQYQQPQQYQQAAAYGAAAPQAKPEKKKGKTGLIIGIIAGVVALIVLAIVLISVLGKKKVDPVTVDLNDYIEVTFTGTNGDGEADVKLNTAKLHEDFDDQLVWTCKKKNQPADQTVTDLLCDNISVYLDKYYYLSNGDKVTLEIYDYFSDYNTYLEDFYGNNAVVVYENSSVTVSGLEEPAYTTFDPFEGVTFDLVGDSGDCWVMPTWRTDLDAMAYLWITSDDDYLYASNGDVIHYYIYGWNDDMKNAMIELYGMYPSVTEFDYTVEGANEPDANGGSTTGGSTAATGYVTSVSQIPANMFVEAVAAADEYLSSTDVYGDPSYAEYNVIYQNVEYVGYYFWTSKDGAAHYDTNILYVIVKVNVNYPDVNNQTQTLSYYYMVRISDLYVEADGSVTFYEEDMIEYAAGTYDYDTNLYTFGTMDVDLANDMVWTVDPAWETLDAIKTAIKDAQSANFNYVSDID